MHPQLKTAMIPCKGRGNVAEALSFTFGGVAFPVPWKDLVYVLLSAVSIA
jgi:hypothetical protein